MLLAMIYSWMANLFIGTSDKPVTAYDVLERLQYRHEDEDLLDEEEVDPEEQYEHASEVWAKIKGFFERAKAEGEQPLPR